MPELNQTFGRQIRAIKHNQLFLVDDPHGNVRAGNNSGFGLYHMDTRFLSSLQIALNGTPPITLLSSSEKGYMSTTVATNGPLEAKDDTGRIVEVAHEMLQLRRETLVFDHLHDCYSVTSYERRTLQIHLSVRLAVDFRDMFEVRGIVPESKVGANILPTIDGSEVVFAHEDRSGRWLESRIRIKSGEPEIVLEGCDAWLHFRWLMTPGSKEHFEFELIPQVGRSDPAREESTEDPPAHADREPLDFQEAQVRLTHQTRQWHDRVTRFHSDDDDFNEMMSRNAKDIHMLLTETRDGCFPAAGIPWFVALFGRDSLITSLFCLPLNPYIARDTLHILARHQGVRNDPDRDEEPGKILHELRCGELAQAGAIPHTPYFGTVDATPLWIILLWEYYRWTADRATLDRLWPNALAAHEWCERNLANSAGGYCTYGHRAGLGILQQGWKDSDDGVVDAAGNVARPPIALCEVQGYLYEARRHLASLAGIRGEDALRNRLQQENRDFRQRFNRDFWMHEHGYLALGLDHEGRPLEVISSNPGHCLASGILSMDHARQVASRLLEPDLFNGWGIRTLSAEMAAYNPLSYHNGSVWPHDNAMIARGLAMMGRMKAVEQLFSGLFTASRHMYYKRLPELFCGIERMAGPDGDPPVRYPVACIPQAWAAATPFSLIQSMVHLAPNAAERKLVIRSPKLPHWLSVLNIDNLRVGDARVDLQFRRTRGNVTVDAKELTGKLNVVVEIAGIDRDEH